MTARNDGVVTGRDLRTVRRRCSGAVLIALATAMLAPGPVVADNHAMDPNTIWSVERFIGPQMTTPEDGRLRGYGFAATITSTGTTEAATRLYSPIGPAPGQRLVAFALRFELLRESSDDAHPMRAILVIDGRRTSLEDREFERSGERSFVASVPTATTQVELEMSAAGLAQSFSLTEGRRVGMQPVVLYRDPVGPDVVNDLNDEVTLQGTNTAENIKGGVAITLKGADLSYFSPGEPIGTAGSPDRAFLILEATGDGVEPSSSDANDGQFFSDFAALPASTVKVHLPDTTVVESRRIGDSKDDLLGGSYYFDVPADLRAARISIEPGTVDASQYKGSTRSPARITIAGEASFDLAFGAPGEAVAATTGTASSPAPRTTKPAAAPIRRDRDSSFPWSLVLGAALLVGLALGWFLRHKRRTPSEWSSPPQSAPWGSAGHAAVTVEDDPAPPEPEPLLDVAGNRICLEGPGSLAAIRAATVEALTGDAEPPNIVVLASGELANLFGPGAGHPAMRVVEDEDMLVSELDVAQLQRQRATIEAQEDGQAPEPSWKAQVVAPGPLEQRTRVHPALRDATVICLGRDSAYPLVFVNADGTITVSGHPEGSRCVEVMTEAEATAALASVAPATEAPLAVHPAGGAQTTTEEAGSAPPISVRVLGSYRIAVRGVEVTSGLRAKARELLAYFALHREGATMDAAMEALWPETDPLKGQAYFRTVVANLRTTLRSGAGLEAGLAVVERVGPRYRLAPRLIAVDLWEFDDALAAANHGDRAGRERAADSYAGDFAAGEDYLWAGPSRQTLRRKAIDNLSAAAEQRRAGGDLEGAVQFLERTIEADPYAEEQYRAVMELQLSLGRRDAAARTLGLLEHRLAELDLRPADVTRQMLT